MKFWLFLFSFTLPLLAFAGPFQITMEAWHHQQLIYNRGPVLEKTEILKSLSNPYLKDKIEVALNVQSPERPLILLMPGLFGNYETVEVRRVAQLLYEQGFNILRVPNPVSNPVIRLEPSYPGLDFESEAMVYVDVLRQIQAEYHFPVVHLAGISYGAFISAVLSVKLGKDFNGKLLLFSPPKNILTSLKVMDGYFDSMKEQFNRLPIQQIGFLLQTYWHRFWEWDFHLTEDFSQTTLIVYGFHRTFLQLSDMREQALNPKPWWRFYEKWDARLTQKRNEMRFITYLKDVNPQFFKNPEKHDVLYWARQSGAEWYLFTSTDDFINSDPKWPQDPHIRVYENGGHIFGYMDQPDFLEKMAVFYK